MKLDQFSPSRIFNKGNMFYETGATNAGFPGGDVPEYTGWKDEQMSWKTTCYIGDWTLCITDLTLDGPDAMKFLADITTNSFEKFDIGQAKHYIQCSEDGKVAAEGVLLRMGEEKFIMQNNVAWAYYLYDENREKYNAKLTMASMKPYKNYSIEADTFKFQLSGPKALYLAEKVTGQNLRDVKFMHFVPVTINGHSDLFALRQGMAGEIGFEIQGPIALADEIYEFIFKEGEEFGCRRLGTRSGSINHLEACFPTWTAHYNSSSLFSEGFIEHSEKNGFFVYYPTVNGSYDGDDKDLTFSPYEMGWASRIKFDHEFIGREALEKESKNIKKNVVTLEFNNEDMIDIYASHFETEQEPYDIFEMPMTPIILMHADKVLNEKGDLIGVAFQPGYSYYFRKILALTMLDVEYCKPGTEVKILWGNPGSRQKLIRATVAPAPYKQDNRKVDLKNL